MGNTCGEPNEINKNTHPNNITALFCEQGKETPGRFIKGGGGQAGDIGFGSSCGPPRKIDYPAMAVEQIKQQCCDLGDGCVAFSWAASQVCQPVEPIFHPCTHREPFN